MSLQPQSAIKFGPFEVTSQVFLKTPLSFALVNIKPFLPGHVLVCPRTPRLRLADLSPEETADLFTTVQRVQRMLAKRYFEPLPSPDCAAVSPAARNGSFNVAIQDGPDAGQTVPHLHVHILPRPAGSTENMTPGTQGNAVYEDMTLEDGNIGGALWDAELGKRPVPGGAYAQMDEESREPRTMDEMVHEAEEYKRILEDMEKVGRD